MTDIDPATGLGYLTAVESGAGNGYVVGPPLSAESEQRYEAADRGTR